jgi:hypothetical protein
MIKRYFTLLCAAALATGAAHAQKIAVSKGLKLEMVSNMKMTMSIEMGGQNIDNNTEGINTTQVELKDVTPAGYLFTNTITKMVMHVNAMGQDVSFDSDKKEDLDGPMGASMKELINKPVDVQVDKQGRVIDNGNDSAAGGGGMNDLMNMGSSVTKGQPFPALVALPGHPVKMGDSWTDSTGDVSTIKMVCTYTVKNVSKEEVVLDFVCKLAKKGTVEQQGMKLDLDLTGITKGTASYEGATGVLKKNDSSSDIKGTMGIMGQSAPLSMTLTASTTAKKL